MNYCSSLVTFMRATMTFEDQLLEQAQKELEATQKLCSDSTKMFSGIKKAFGMSSSNSSNKVNEEKKKVYEEKKQTLEEKFTKAIILADCKLFLAILTFVRQDGSYLSSGLLQIRRSWKSYARVQKQLYEIYKKTEPNAKDIYGSNSEIVDILIDDNGDENNNDPKNSEILLNELTIEDDEISETKISSEAVKRLLGAVSFGYGLFQVSLSFMPPNALKLIKIFGFEGDRSIALKAISFTSKSKDMRAPFADMVLLWYSTIATPLLGVSAVDIRISDEDTKQIIEKNLTRYPKSSLFYYFKGKFCRTSLHDLKASLENYEIASENSKHIREIQFISIYEIGWLHLQNLDFEKSLEYFHILSKESKWSRSFNGYISAVVAGSSGKFDEANAYTKEAIKIISSQKRKKNPIEVFALKRLEYFKKNPIKTKNLCELLSVEMLFLWVCFPYCDEDKLNKMLEICDRMTDKQFVGMKCLFEGAIHIALKNADVGEQFVNESIARVECEKKGAPFGKYVLPYCHYLLANYQADLEQYDLAKSHMNKAKDNYKDYELEDRIQTQIRGLQRRIKLIHDDPKSKEIKESEEAKIKKEKEDKENNFYL